jgi:hypothetical protein
VRFMGLSRHLALFVVKSVVALSLGWGVVRLSSFPRSKLGSSHCHCIDVMICSRVSTSEIPNSVLVDEHGDVT